MHDEIEFNSIKDLYRRVLPALNSKVNEIKKHGYKLVTEKDVWDYLVQNNWKNKIDLELNDLVCDILYVDNYAIHEYVLNKLKEIKGKADNKDNSVL